MYFVGGLKGRVIRIQQRSGRKRITTIAGLAHDLDQRAKYSGQNQMFRWLPELQKHKSSRSTEVSSPHVIQYPAHSDSQSHYLE